MRRTKLFLPVLLSAVVIAWATSNAAAKALPSIAEKTKGLERRAGLLPLYSDPSAGRLWLEVPNAGTELIHVVALTTGVGSNDIGLDRSQLGAERIVRFERAGNRLLLVQPNLAFRAESADPDERRAVEESFARSVLWGFEIAAVTGERLLIDVTAYALADHHGVVRALKDAEQGEYKLEASRSALFDANVKAFPRNTEIEATLTFTGATPGAWVRDVTPTPEAITVRQRLSFVALPPPGYVPRANDPRSGFFGISFRDYAVPLGAPMTKRWIARHRLQKKDPTAAVSDAVEPIVYYLDRGVPEPVRQALLDGARWWAQAFEGAGYRDAFRVEMLPAGADPMDVRYNVIQWVHRATRGWSYGSQVADPRTGEILKGHVLLGSLRVRQDMLLAEGLLAPYVSGDEPAPEVEAFALARLRQLSAHEVGHTLGLAHNYLASSYGRGSVMDYPHPLVALGEDGRVRLDDAYAIGIGVWDRVAIAYGYQDFPAGTDEAVALDRLLAGARERGIAFLTDQDARPAGGAHPAAHLWDNGADPVAELDRVLRVRAAALARFGEAVIRRGEPLASMEEALVPLYLHHRYQTEAAVKLVGGVDYAFTMRGDGQPGPHAVPPDVQSRALTSVLATLTPDVLRLPAAVRDAIPPRPYLYPSHRELFTRWTDPAFDAIAPAAVAARMTVALLLAPERAARLVTQRALAPSLPGLDGVLERLVTSTFGRAPADPYDAEIVRAVQRVVTEELIRLAAESPHAQVRALARSRLDALGRLARRGAARADVPGRAHMALVAADIAGYLERGERPPVPPPPSAPPGSPIGLDAWCASP